LKNNLLDIKGLGSLIRSTWTWRLLRLALLGLMLVMVASGWHQHAIPGVAVRDPLMYTNLTTFLFWAVWLMGVVLIALPFGRGWCTICPLGWLNGLVSRFGLQRALPGWLGNFVPVTLVLVALQLGVYFFALHRFPDYSAVLLTWMLGFALLLGLVFKRRTFCQLLCPAGAVFGLYARVAPFELRVKDQAVCSDCQDKPCIATAPVWKQAVLGGLRMQWRSRPEGCPVDLVPAEISDSATCTLCLNCAQTCCNDNVRLGFRRWPGDLLQGGLRPSESLFFLVLLGLLTANFAKVYVDLREAIFWPPTKLALALGWEAAGYYPLAVVWLALLFPLLLVLPGALVYLLGQVRVTALPAGAEPEAAPSAAAGQAPTERFWPLLGRLALPLLPLLLAAHLVLALVKFNAKLGYLPLVLQDPSGVKSYLALNVMQTMTAPGVLIPLDLLKWLIAGALLLGAGVAALAARRIARRADGGLDRPYLVASLVNILVLCALYGATVFEWLFVR